MVEQIRCNAGSWARETNQGGHRLVSVNYTQGSNEIAWREY
jgi:hypothetical protein